MKEMKNLFFAGFLIFAVLVQPAFAFADEPASVEQATEEVYEINADVYYAGEYLLNVLDIIDRAYVGSDVSIDELIDGAISGMTEKLDDYSEFFDDKETYDFIDNVEQSQYGMGISYFVSEGQYPVVFDVFIDGPADKAGVKEKDVIISIDGNDVKDLSEEGINEIVKKNKDKAIELKVKRESQIISLNITVGQYSMPTVFVSKLQDLAAGLDKQKADKARYVQITSFTSNTGAEFKKAVERMKKENVESIILDLRYNPGGVVDAAYDVCEALIQDDAIISVGTKDYSQIVVSENKEAPFKNIAVLVNGETASSAELTAAALKEKGAVVIGSNTFGKGVVQALITLPEHGTLKLTTEEIFTKSGKKINGVGVAPDVLVPEIDVLDMEESIDRDKVVGALKNLGFRANTPEEIFSVLCGIQSNYGLDITGCPDYMTAAAINQEIIKKNMSEDKVLEKGISIVLENAE